MFIPSITTSPIGKNEKYVLTNQAGNYIHLDRPYRALKNAVKKLGIEGDVHSLRHSFAMHLLQSHTSEYKIQTLLGHSDIKMTKEYAKHAPDHLKKTVEKL